MGHPDNSYNGEVIDIGQLEFNEAFQFSAYHIIRRECPSCGSEDNKVIYYKRLTGGSTFDAYSYMKVWRSSNNIINSNFALYSSLEDAIYDNNRWQYCNYDDLKVGAFRDCGKTYESRVGCDWTADVFNGGNNFANCNRPTKFSIYVGTGSNLVSAAQQPDLLTFDRFHANGNELSGPNKSKHYLAAYFMYGILVLMIINIVCIGIYCFSKRKRKYKQYKVVSIESSDTEADIDKI